MSDSRKAALEALEPYYALFGKADDEKVITALRAALAEEDPTPEQLAERGWQAIDCPNCGEMARAFPKAEPFGYVSEHNCEGPYKYQFHLDQRQVYWDNCKSVKAVYTAPQPRRKLTDEEIRKALRPCFEWEGQVDEAMLMHIDEYRAIEDAIWSKT